MCSLGSYRGFSVRVGSNAGQREDADISVSSYHRAVRKTSDV